MLWRHMLLPRQFQVLGEPLLQQYAGSDFQEGVEHDQLLGQDVGLRCCNHVSGIDWPVDTLCP